MRRRVHGQLGTVRFDHADWSPFPAIQALLQIDGRLNVAHVGTRGHAQIRPHVMYSRRAPVMLEGSHEGRPEVFIEPGLVSPVLEGMDVEQMHQPRFVACR